MNTPKTLLIAKLAKEAGKKKDLESKNKLAHAMRDLYGACWAVKTRLYPHFFELKRGQDIDDETEALMPLYSWETVRKIIALNEIKGFEKYQTYKLQKVVATIEDSNGYWLA